MNSQLFKSSLLSVPPWQRDENTELVSLAGIQSFPQLTEEYGVHGSQTLLDLFNTKVFFRNDNPQTNQWISQVLGEKETKSIQESLSYGANTMRDGVSLSRQKKREPLVLPIEIAHLNDLECYLKLPGKLASNQV